MSEERKHAILFATTILCARKIIDTINGHREKGSPWRHHTLALFEKEAIVEVLELMKLIDEACAAGKKTLLGKKSKTLLDTNRPSHGRT